MVGWIDGVMPAGSVGSAQRAYDARGEATEGKMVISGVYPAEQAANPRTRYDVLHVCGRAAGDGLWDWVSLERFDMVCGMCAKTKTAQVPNQWRDSCGMSRATGRPAPTVQPPARLR